MPDRSLTVALRATVTGYVSSMRTATTATTGLGTAAQRTGAQASAGLAQVDRAAATTASSMRTAQAATTASAAGIARAGGAARDASGRFVSAGTAAAGASANISRTGTAAATAAAGLGRTSGAADVASRGLGRTEGAAARATSRMGALEHGAGAAGLSLRTLGLGAAAVAAIGFGAAIKTAAEFEKKMSAVRANVHLGAVSFDSLTDAVKTSGTEFGFTALESADAAEDLAKAGLSAAQIIGGGLTGALTLAAAGNISTGEAAETAATSMTMFGLAAKDIPHIADLLAAGADRSTASVHSLSEGLQDGGSLAHLMGVSIEDTTAILAEFDQSGLKGAKAGNALKTMFQNMLAPSTAQQKVMEQLNLSFFDANGKFIGLAATADELKNKLGGLDDKSRNAALSVLFGARSIQAANILYKDGSGKIKEWAGNVNDGGFAARNAGAKTDNLIGDLNKTKAAAQNAAISLGSRFNPALRESAQFATSAVKGTSKLVGGLADLGAEAGSNTIGRLPSSLQTAAVAMGVTAVASKLLGSRLTGMNSRIGSIGPRMLALGGNIRATGQLARGAAPQMGRLSASMAALSTGSGSLARIGTSFGTAAAGAARFPRAAGLAAASMTSLKLAGRGFVGALGGPLGLALTAGVVGLSLWQKHQQSAAQKVAEHKARVDELTASIQKDGGELGKATAAQIAKNLVDSGTIDTAKQMGVSQELLTQAWLGQPEALSKVNSKLDAYDTKALQSRDVNGRLTKSAGEQRAAVDKVRSAMQGQVKDTGDVTAKNHEYANAQKIAAGALAGTYTAIGSYNIEQARLAAATKNSTQANKDLDDSLKNINNTFLGLRGSSRAYQAAIDDATAAVKKNGQTLDEHTAKGRENAEALDKVATSGLEMIAALRKNGATAAELAPKVAGLKTQLYATAAQFGLTGKAADSYVNGALGKIPSEIKTTITADFKKADSQVRAARAAVRDLGVDFDSLPASVQTDIIATGGKNAKAQVDGVTNSARRLPGEARVGVSAPGADQATGLVKKLSVAAVTADGKIVNIPCTTPGQAAALHNLLAITGAAVTADGKKVVIPSSTPLSKATIAELKKIDGVAVTADGKSVSINTDSPGAWKAAQDILSAGAAADAVNGKRAYIRVVTDFVKNHIDNFEKNFGSGFFGQATGGAAGIPGLAAGGVDYRGGGQVTGPGTSTSDSILARLATGPVRLSNREHVLTAAEVQQMGGHGAVLAMRHAARAGQFKLTGHATGGPAGVDFADWARAMPVASSQTQNVRVTTQLAAADRALLQRVATQAQVPVHATLTVDGKKLAQAVTQGNRSMRRN